MSQSSIRDRILAAQDITKETLAVPEWDVTLEIRGMTAGERSRLQESSMDSEGKMNLSKIYPELVIASAYDPETGIQVFSADDRDVLLTKSAKALDRVAEVAMELSGFTDKSKDKAGKGSSVTPTDASPSS